MEEVIYFIENVDSGHIKIGTTTQTVEGRLRSMQTGNPSALVVLGTMDGHADVEAELHSKFAHLNGRGEWFRADPELYEYIVQHAKIPDSNGMGTDGERDAKLNGGG